MWRAELLKMKKSRIFYICSVLVILPAIWMIYKDARLVTPPEEISNWLQSVNVICSLFLSISSGFVITFLIHREYEDKTIINVLSAPTSRTVFLFSKFFIWFLWYVLLLGILMVLYSIGGKLVYPGRFGTEEIELLLHLVAKSRMTSFLASSPLLLVAVLQRRTFYPTIMCSLVFTGIELSALTIPIRVASSAPWSAAMLFSYGITGGYRKMAMLAVITSGLVGIVGGWLVFRRQNQ